MTADTRAADAHAVRIVANERYERPTGWNNRQWAYAAELPTGERMLLYVRCDEVVNRIEPFVGFEDRGSGWSLDGHGGVSAVDRLRYIDQCFARKNADARPRLASDGEIDEAAGLLITAWELSPRN